MNTTTKSLTFRIELERSVLRATFMLISICCCACEDFVKIDPPRTDLVRSTVFATDATAQAAMLDIYYQMRTSGFATGTTLGISFLNALTSDEMISYSSSSPKVAEELRQFNDNALLANNSIVFRLWSDLYEIIYKTNAIIEGIETSPDITDDLRQQLAGEAKFLRAFCHFYLVNLFGDVPLVLSTDFRINSAIPRMSAAQVYQQIINDLIEAQNLLSADYNYSNAERVRPNKGTATALLSRVYLYTKDWPNAETQATALIENQETYNLVADLSHITAKNNREAIWQLWSDNYPSQLFTFYIFSEPPPNGALRDEFVNGFEVNDRRREAWVASTGRFSFARKYSSFTLTEYSTVFRLAEQYLIRAEARAHQNKVVAAQEDVNTIRSRAGLSDTEASDKDQLLLAIEKERKSELFTEWGHRWFDLNRTGRSQTVFATLKPTWVATSALYPIPESEIMKNSALQGAQNPGY